VIKRSLKQIANMMGLDYAGADIEISGISIDSRHILEGNLFVPFRGEHADGHVYVEKAIESGAAAALWQKDVPNPPYDLPILLVDDTLEALQRLASEYLKQTQAKVVGITGSNGKTTTKDMTASLLAQQYKVHKTGGNYNNHLGLPLTILAMDEETEIVILEMGMSNRGEIELLSKLARPDVAVITNVGEAHLLDLGSREAIAEAKLEITAGLKEKGVLIYHGDEPLLCDKLNHQAFSTCKFGRAKENDIFAERIETVGTGTIFKTNLYENEMELPILGNHNVLNAMAAILVARHFNISVEQIKNGLSQLKVTNMRMEMLEGLNGEKIINDAYNASPTSMNAAIELVGSLTGFRQKILVLGDMLELGEEEVQFHKKIGESISKQEINKVFTYGQLGKHIAIGAEKALGKVNVFAFEDKVDLIEELKKHVGKNDLILVKASRGMKLEEVVQALCK